MHTFTYDPLLLILRGVDSPPHMFFFQRCVSFSGSWAPRKVGFRLSERQFSPPFLLALLKGPGIGTDLFSGLLVFNQGFVPPPFPRDFPMFYLSFVSQVANQRQQREADSAKTWSPWAFNPRSRGQIFVCGGYDGTRFLEASVLGEELAELGG